MNQKWVQRIRNILRRASVDVMKFDAANHPLARRKALIEEYRIDLLFDIGANIGQFALEMRSLGYRGWIVSYEPLSAAFSELQLRATRDPRWKVVNAGLGPTATRATINVAGNSQSSSLLPMLEQHLRSAPESAYVGTEEITLQTLAAALGEFAPLGTKKFVKIDAQGYESAILASAGAALADVIGVQLEMSLTPLYEGERLMPDMISYLGSLGYDLMSIEPGYADPTSGRLLQADGVFFRTRQRKSDA